MCGGGVLLWSLWGNEQGETTMGQSYNTTGCGFTARMGWCYRLKKTCKNRIRPVNLKKKNMTAIRADRWCVTCTLSPSCAWRDGPRCLDRTPQPDWRHFLAPRLLRLLHHLLAASPSARGIKTIFKKLHFPSKVPRFLKDNPETTAAALVWFKKKLKKDFTR